MIRLTGIPRLTAGVPSPLVISIAHFHVFCVVIECTYNQEQFLAFL